LYGTEVLTLGGSRGPSVSYYVPFLSAMQLLLPVPSHDTPAQQQSAAASRHRVAPEAIPHTQQQQLPPDKSLQSDSQQGGFGAEMHQRPILQEHDAAKQAQVHQLPAIASEVPRLGRVYEVAPEGLSAPTEVLLHDIKSQHGWLLRLCHHSCLRKTSILAS